MRIDADELDAKVKAFKATHPPDSTSQLEWLRPTILGFYLDGYSKKSTYEFLKGAGLVRCSQLAFYRWLAKHMDLEAEARALVAATASVTLSRATPAKSAQQESAAGAAVEPSRAKLNVSAAPPAKAGTAAPPEGSALMGDIQGDDPMPDAISHAKLGEAESAHSDSAKEAPVRAAPAKTAQQENALAATTSETNVASPQPAQDQTDATLSTTQSTSVKSTQDRAPISDERRQQLVQLMNEQLAEMEQSDMGAMSDRALARLEQRDKGHGGRDG